MSRQRQVISDWEDLFEREDGSRPLLDTLQRAWDITKEEGCRLRVEIRTHAEGVVGSSGEHNLTIDTKTKTPEDGHAGILAAVRGSPGTGFNGELRINFYKAGSSGERFTSFTRRVAWQHEIGAVGDSSGEMYDMARREGSLMERTEDRGRDRDRDRESYDDGSEEYVEDPRAEENSVESLRPRRSLNLPPFERPAPYAMPPTGGGAHFTNQQMTESWGYTGVAMGFAFKAMAQNTETTDKILRMIEGMALRFGLPEAPEISLLRNMKQESQKENQAAAQNQGGGMAALLPLVNAAMHLIGSDSPKQAVERGVGLASGEPPPEGAASRFAIQRAGQAVRAITNRRPPPAELPQRAPRQPIDPRDDGGGAEFEDSGYEEEEYMNDSGMDDSGMDDVGMEESSGSRSFGGPPDLRGLDADQVKRAVFDWIDSDPANKQAIMSMSGELIGKVTG